MKSYEDVTRYHLLPRSYVFCRIDGRSFHSYLKKCEKPFDKGVMEDMDNTAIYLCENIQNAKLGYVQSDEITIMLCDFTDYNTSQFFDGNIQKISSVVASMAAARFNQLRSQRFINTKSMNLLGEEFNLATFDCRCWVVPSQWEACNTFIWRNQDCSRNSVSMVAQSLFSPKELHGKSTPEMHEMMKSKNVNWATDYTDGEKNGRLIVKEIYDVSVSIPDDANFKVNSMAVQRTRWVAQGAWKFTENKEKLLAMIPSYPV